MGRTCCIFGAGEYGSSPSRPELPSDSFIIAADGGLARLKEWSIRPHLAVGDFDSLGFVPQGVEVVCHPPEKDDTDMLLAVNEGLARGCTRFLLYGGLGGRPDHTLANFHVLAHLAGLGCAPFLLGADWAVTAVQNASLLFPSDCRGTVSVFPWGGPAEAVTLTGLRYPLTRGTLSPTYPLGVSNEFTGEDARISVENGTLLVLWEQPRITSLPSVI